MPPKKFAVSKSEKNEEQQKIIKKENDKIIDEEIELKKDKKK